MRTMIQKKTIGCMLAVFLLISTSFGVLATTSNKNYRTDSIVSPTSLSFDGRSRLVSAGLPTAVAVADSNPFYTLIATPLAVNYNEQGEQHVIPLYVKNFKNPSSAVERAEEQTGRHANFLIDDILSPKEASLAIAELFWESSTTVLLIKEDTEGYNLGVVATPLASYLSIPVIVTDSFDQDVEGVLEDLGVENLYVCGDLGLRNGDDYNIRQFHVVDEIINECILVISQRFGKTVNYITLANPLDITSPAVLDKTTYEFEDTIASAIFLPTQMIKMLTSKSAGVHEFVVPSDYKFARIKIVLENLNSGKDAEDLGDRCQMLLNNPEGYRYIYAVTGGGIAERDSKGTILRDKVDIETTIYDKTGTYTLDVYGQWFASKKGSYHVSVTVEKLENAYVPLMSNLSSLAPYLAAYHQGIIFAKPEFAFAASDEVIYNGSTCPGVSQPGTNPLLIVPGNEHTLQIHSQLNELLATIADIPMEDLEALKNHYTEHPVYIAITADPTMVPMYFYYNPDGTADNAMAYMMGFGLPSDFIWGDIDPKPSDAENNTYSYWPFQENIVGRVTGRDVQDCSALLARTFFYNDIIDDLGEWKNNALVQTGCGIEFQNLPIVTRLSHLLYNGRGEPTKFPTGETTFINKRLTENLEEGYTTVKNTFWLQSQREGFTRQQLREIKKTGLLNRFLFPASYLHLLDSNRKVTGGEDHLASSFIFTFAHGSYNLFEHGDVFMDTKGFPGVTMFARIYPTVRSSLSNKGSYDLRAVENMQYGPSVLFVVSCITARTDAIPGKNVLSQAFLHAGLNAYIGATRVTADPGYLEPRPLPGGWGIGILGLLKAKLDLRLRHQYPDLHFGAVIAEELMKDLIENNADIGTALRNAKNQYLPRDANASFLWTPPLSLSSDWNFILDQYGSLSGEQSDGKRERFLDKKYVCLHEFTLYGDPMFNPYQPVNEG